MNRFEYALLAAGAPHEVPLVQLAAGFMLAVQQTLLENQHPQTDPAVLLLGAFIAFQTHADVNTNKGYHQLLGLCQDRLHNGPTLQ
jgi:hypothetical protein